MWVAVICVNLVISIVIIVGIIYLVRSGREVQRNTIQAPRSAGPATARTSDGSIQGSLQRSTSFSKAGKFGAGFPGRMSSMRASQSSGGIAEVEDDSMTFENPTFVKPGTQFNPVYTDAADPIETTNVYGDVGYLDVAPVTSAAPTATASASASSLRPAHSENTSASRTPVAVTSPSAPLSSAAEAKAKLASAPAPSKASTVVVPLSRNAAMAAASSAASVGAAPAPSVASAQVNNVATKASAAPAPSAASRAAVAPAPAPTSINALANHYEDGGYTASYGDYAELPGVSQLQRPSEGYVNTSYDVGSGGMDGMDHLYGELDLGDKDDNMYGDLGLFDLGHNYEALPGTLDLGSTPGPSSSLGALDTPPPPAAAAAAAAAWSAPDSGAHSWLHGALTREQSENILATDMRTGAFLVRIKEPGKQWALSLVHEGQFVHYLIVRDGRGLLTVNDHTLAVPCSTVSEVIAYLRSPAHTSLPAGRHAIEQALRFPVAPK